MLGFPQDFLRKAEQQQIRAVFRKSMKLLKDFKFINWLSEGNSG